MSLGGSKNSRSQKMDMNLMDIFSDSKKSNNLLNNKAIEKISKRVVNYVAYITI